MPQAFLEDHPALEGMRVERIGPTTYLCHSQDQPNMAYTVELLDYNALGSCTCYDFKTRRFPRWQLVRLLYPNFRCKHLRRMRNYVMDHILLAKIKALNAQHQNQHQHT